MKKIFLPALGLAAAFALSPIAGVASADAAPVKHMSHHHVVHHSKPRTVCKVMKHKKVCHVVHHKAPVHHKTMHHTAKKH
jgi:hypothetical protein